AAGVRARVEGQWLSGPRGEGPAAARADGILAVARVERAGSDPSLADRIRNWTVESIARLYGDRAPLVEMLVLDRRGGVDRDLLDRYAESGLVHLLSISGFHVGLIVGWCYLGLRLLRLGPGASLGWAAAAAGLHVAFLGWPAPATRAAALAALLAVGRIRQRRVQPGALLAVSCLAVLLIDPWAVRDLGAWLSASALWGATTFTRWSDRALGDGVWWRTLFASIGATLATAPITAAFLGTVSLVGIGLNFVAIPLAAVVVPGIVASLVLLPVWPGAAEALAAGGGGGLALLDLLAIQGAAVPGGHLVQPAEPASAVPWVVVLAGACWGIGTRNVAAVALVRWSAVAAALVWLVLALDTAGAARFRASGLALHFLDVGQGDAAAIRTPGGRWVVVDAGPASERADAGRRVVVPFLRRRGARRVEAVVVSHAHADHLGGVPALLERIPTGLVLEPGWPVAEPLYLEFLEGVEARGVGWRRVRAGERFVLDGVHFEIVHPDTAWKRWGEDLNEDSVVLRVRYHAFEALLAGDIGLPAESALAGRVGRVDLLKVGHHGSAGSTGTPWLAELRPRAAVISLGVNRYGHPAPATVGRLRRAGVSLWRTDRDGSVTVTTDGRRMVITADGREERFQLTPE
ncbi:MAG TPA: DNA internalization-related competence protein ComEC/Rec2, partial [Gemmatimonadales bacterium]|nr:DNA internalization-related competence protein ComEC/Rec2 [Gemmatimonadales bacterium]